jgi:hypothetical protein
LWIELWSKPWTLRSESGYKQVLNIAQRQRVADIHHHRQADDLWRCLEVAEAAGVAHPLRLAAHPYDRNPIFF